jgi:hypothetical protein
VMRVRFGLLKARAPSAGVLCARVFSADLRRLGGFFRLWLTRGMVLASSCSLRNMSKKPSKRRKQSLVVTQPAEAATQCPLCGLANSEKSLSLMDQLFRSHVELCAGLRLAGRQILRFENQDDQSLRKIRGVLKRADNIRKALIGPNDLPEALNNTYELGVEPTTPVSEFSSHQNDGPVRKSGQKRSRLIRPNSLRIVRFPTG